MRALLLDTPPMGIPAQMAMDEAVLDTVREQTPILRFYRWPGRPPHGATFGYFQPVSEVEAAARRRGPLLFPLVRRPTGGGIVFHDGDLTFSYLFPWPRAFAPSRIYKDIHLAVHLGLKAQNIPSRLWSERPWGGTPAGECFSGPQPMDLVHEDGTKFLGGALRRRRGIGLYQGSLRPEGFQASAVALELAVLEGFSLKFRFILEAAVPSVEAMSAARRLVRERYGSDSWNRKR